MSFKRNKKQDSKRIPWKRRENLRKGNLDRRRKQWFQKSLREAEFLRTNIRTTMDWTRKGIRTERQMGRDGGIYGKVIKERDEKEILVMEN